MAGPGELCVAGSALVGASYPASQTGASPPAALSHPQDCGISHSRCALRVPRTRSLPSTVTPAAAGSRPAVPAAPQCPRWERATPWRSALGSLLAVCALQRRSLPGQHASRGSPLEIGTKPPFTRSRLVTNRLNCRRAAGARSRPCDAAKVLGPAGRRHAVPALAARGPFQSGSYGGAGPGDGLRNPRAAGAGQVGRTQPPPASVCSVGEVEK